VCVRHSTCVRSTLDQLSLLHVFTLLILTTITLVMLCVAGIWFGDDAAAAAEALHRTQPETFAGAFGRGADAADGVAASHNLFDHMLGATVPALAMVLLAFACLVRLVTPFEAAMHWLEVIAPHTFYLSYQRFVRTNTL